MTKTIRRRLVSALTALGCTAAAIPASLSITAAELAPARTVYETDFEDGDVSQFSKRGDTDTSVIGTSADGVDGSACMAVTGRSKGWNGPQFLLDDICEAGVKYTATCWVKTAWYNSCKLSLQYTDASGSVSYSNLSDVVSQGDWVQIPEVKFSFSEDVHDVYLYVECNDGADMFVDNFSLKTAPVYSIEQDIPSLKEVYADYFKIGGAVTADELAPQSTKALILKHYNSITLGNELKPENMLDQAGCQAAAEAGNNGEVAVSLNGAARTILNFCRDNSIPVRGHVLVWHSQTPGWFFKEDYTTEGAWVDKETMLVRMENYIKGVFAVLEDEYPDVDFYAWDVVNEAWLDGGTPRTGGMYDENPNYSGWTQVFGDNSFIPYAFRYARKYAPEGCKLYYNDFNEYMPQKTAAIITMCEELQKENLIDGIGMQSHLDVTFPGISAYRTAVTKFAATGLDIQVTELDATTSDLTEAGFEAQAQYYSDIMDILVEYADSISAVVFWGTTDDMSWRASKSPLLFNEDYTAKPAFYAIIDGFTVENPDPGDINADGKRSALDVVILQKYLLARRSLSQDEAQRADLSNDGKVNVTDLVLLKQLLL